MAIRFLLNARLQEQNLPLTWLAEEVGGSVVAWRRLKNDRAASIKFDTLSGLCEALYCEPGELFEFTPNPATRGAWRLKRDRQKLVIRAKMETTRLGRFAGLSHDD